MRKRFVFESVAEAFRWPSEVLGIRLDFVPERQGRGSQSFALFLVERRHKSPGAVGSNPAGGASFPANKLGF